MREFIEAFDTIQRECHLIAKSKGWHEEERNPGEMIALMHSELSEALEALRHGNLPSDHIPNFVGIEEELADVIIRIMDFAELRVYWVSRALIDKMEFNRSREYKHGKRF